jgi:glycosyltransferase involved in cell wall biosynthesis
MQELLPGWWIPSCRRCVIHNALQIDKYANGSDNQTDREKRTSLRILNVGRLSPEKGQSFLIRAVADLVSEYPGITLAIAGVGPVETDLRGLVDRLGIEDHVEFLGFVPDMPQEYARSDVVVQSSITEGLPNVVLEAAFMGVPIIATRVGGTGEVIEHGISGYLVSPNSEDQLAMALRSFGAGRERHIRMADAARQRVIDEFSFDRRITRITEMYQTLMARQ